MRPVHLVLPNDIDDPRRPSGGNSYDRRVSDGLRGLGRPVHEHSVRGPWPDLDTESCRALELTLAGLPRGAVVVVDGLLGSAGEVLAAHGRRLRLVVLVHLPLGPGSGEGRTLAAAVAALTTSRWTARWLLEHYPLDERRVHVAAPGVDPAPPTRRSPGGVRLLCVGAVTPVKGQDLLVEALHGVRDLEWRACLVGSTEVDPAYAALVRQQVERLGLGDRVRLTGPLTGERLAAAYAGADLLLAPSRQESYGMTIVEALARGLPVLAADVDGVPESLGRGLDGVLPGALLDPHDVSAWTAALRGWLTGPDLRRALRGAASSRRGQLRGWDDTVRLVARVLERVESEEVVAWTR